MNFIINRPELKPVITNNVGMPAFILREVTPETELVCCYTNRTFEKEAIGFFKDKNFSFLCKDTDDLSFVYCRNDKLEKFKEKLENYV